MRRIATLLCLVALIVPAATHAAVRAVSGGVEFTYADPSAGSVSLAGAFNDWSTSANPLTDPDGDGTWSLVLELDPGKYEYKFVVNGGTWIADPDNPLVSGDYDNSLVEVTADGSLGGGAPATTVQPSGTPTVSNTPLHSKVYIGGFFRMFMEGKTEVEGDKRLRLDRPDDQFNLDVTTNLNSKIWATMRLQLRTGLGGANELNTELYKARSNFTEDNFEIAAFYNDEIFSSDDPLELMGSLDLRGTISREKRDFGQGHQGLLLKIEPWGSDLQLMYTDTFDEDIFNPNEPTVIDPRKDGLNQATGTDILFGRWTKNVGPTRMGLTYRGEFSDWWVNFTKEENPLPPELQAYLDAQTDKNVDDKSDNFEMAADRQFGAFDVAYPMDEDLDVAASVGYGWQESRWSLGNRETLQGQSLANGKVDVPVGNMQLYRAKAILDYEREGFVATVSHELDYQRGMDSGESEILYRTQPGSMISDRDRFSTQEIGQIYQDVNGTDALDILRLGPAPERTSHITRFEVGYFWEEWGLEMDFQNRVDDMSYVSFWDLGATELDRSILRVSPRLAWRPFDDAKYGLNLSTEILAYDNPEEFDRIAAENLAPNLPGQGYGSMVGIDSREFVLEGLVPARDILNAPLDLRFDLRYVDYAGPENLADGDGNALDLDASYFAPFAALVYNPSPRVVVEFGFGVDPRFYNVISAEGWPNGRQQWRDEYLIERRLDPYNPINVLQAEKALEDQTQIVINALVTF